MRCSVPGRWVVIPALSGLLLSAGACAGADTSSAPNLDSLTAMRGAVYLPAGAFNAPQMWKNFSPPETRRDFGYAKEIHLNALRLWASYEYWRMAPDRFQRPLDELLGAAHQAGIRVLISLFEQDGVPPTGENMWTTNPAVAFDIQSPGPKITSDERRWERPRSFVEWFMEHYRNDQRLLAIADDPALRLPQKKTLPPGFLDYLRPKR
jgi:hypothetical protein